MSETIELLRTLAALDRDAADAYDAAAERLEDVIFKAQLAAFGADHRRHVVDLDRLLHSFGGRLAAEDIMPAEELVGRDSPTLVDLTDDYAILLAMKSDEDGTTVAYERAVARNLGARVLPLLTRHLGDERRHHAYLVQALASVGRRRHAERNARASISRIPIARPSGPRTSSPSLY